MMQGYFEGAASTQQRVIGIAAPHISPHGGWQSYRAAYQELTPDLRDRTFVVLGTSHYGQPDMFGLTRKPFATPFGTTRVDSALVNELGAQPGVLMEDYCHAVEHSIEFQVVFLQSIFGPDIRILPVLCGSFWRGAQLGGPPENDENVKRFFAALGEIAEREKIASSGYWASIWPTWASDTVTNLRPRRIGTKWHWCESGTCNGSTKSMPRMRGASGT